MDNSAPKPWRSEKRQRQHLICVRLLPSERVLLEAAAKADGMSVSGWVRECALVRAESALASPQTTQGGNHG